MLERGFKFRKQPLLCMATNSGTDKKNDLRVSNTSMASMPSSAL
ncbi:hypothetical protein SAMN05444385_11430 [Tritonibacter mobilis]|jgi:hypothetical protein|nr:hypothetical protein SAMN05444385_11430 [Tritonibacter mobilis]